MLPSCRFDTIQHGERGRRSNRRYSRMVHSQVIVVLSVMLFALPAVAAAQEARPDNGGRKQARAVRVADGAIRVDGRLDEQAWRAAPPLTDFVQKEPVEGAPPADRMDVRFT